MTILPSLRAELERGVQRWTVTQCLGPFGLLWQKYHSWGATDSRHLCFTVLEAGKSTFKVLADLGSGEDLLPGSQAAVSSLCPQVAEGVRQPSGVSFYEHTNPTQEDSPSVT